MDPTEPSAIPSSPAGDGTGRPADVPATSSRGLPARDLALIAVFAGVTAALGLIPPLPVPLSPVPVTAQSLGPLLAGAILGAKRGALSQVLLIALVLLGLPLLAGGRGGLGVLGGVTVGFFLGWVPLAWLVGALTYALGAPYRVWQGLIIAVLGTVVLYACGLTGMMGVGRLGPGQAALGLLPFVPGDAVKAVLVATIAHGVHRSYPRLLPPGIIRRRRDAVPAGPPSATATTLAREYVEGRRP